MKIAHERLREAQDARAQIVTAPGYGQQMINGLDDELENAMVAMAAAAHAIDAFYGSVRDRVQLPEHLLKAWEDKCKRPKRPGRILETLKAGFDLAAKGNVWAGAFPELFQKRDFALHHESEAAAPVEHPTGRTYVSREQGTYTLEAANDAISLAHDVIATCLDSPRPTQPKLVEWVNEAKHHGEVVQGYRSGVL